MSIRWRVETQTYSCHLIRLLSSDAPLVHVSWVSRDSFSRNLTEYWSENNELQKVLEACWKPIRKLDLGFIVSWNPDGPTSLPEACCFVCLCAVACLQSTSFWNVSGWLARRSRMLITFGYNSIWQHSYGHLPLSDPPLSDSPPPTLPPAQRGLISCPAFIITLGGDVRNMQVQYFGWMPPEK